MSAVIIDGIDRRSLLRQSNILLLPRLVGSRQRFQPVGRCIQKDLFGATAVQAITRRVGNARPPLLHQQEVGHELHEK